MAAIEGRIVGGVASGRGGDADVRPDAPAGKLDQLMAGPGGLTRFLPDSAFHTVQKGETLAGIAAALGTDWPTLARINGLADPDRLAVGQKLQVPEARQHVVRAGETVSGIARETGTSTAAIVAANRLADADLIRPGQLLSLGSAPPFGGSRASVAAASRAAPAGAPSSPATGRPTPDPASVAAADIAADRAAGLRSQGKCYAWVKTALQRSGAVPDYMPGVAAKGAGPALESRGFVNVMNAPDRGGIRSPYDAPKGAVLVYGAAPGAVDRNAKYGHIEIRTGSGFASDYASANARTGGPENGLAGRGRELIGVYVKPAAVASPTAPAAFAPAAGVPNGDRFAAANLSLGANERFRGAIEEAATRTGMTPQSVAAIINAETLRDANGLWQTNARAGTSSATGMTQFLSGTWVAEATRAGGVLNAEARAAGLVDGDNRVVDRAALLEARNDPRLSILAGADYARFNVAALQRSGHAPADASPGAVARYAYLAHHEGLGGARGFLSGDMRYLRDGTFEANVPRTSRQSYLDAAGGSEPLAYRNWLSDYTDRRIDVRDFMIDRTGVDVPATRSLYR